MYKDVQNHTYDIVNRVFFFNQHLVSRTKIGKIGIDSYLKYKLHLYIFYQHESIKQMSSVFI